MKDQLDKGHNKLSDKSGLKNCGIMVKCWRLVPSFKGFGLAAKISLTFILAGFCADLFYAKINPALPLLKGALTFSPLSYTQALVEKGHLKTAEAYIEF